MNKRITSFYTIVVKNKVVAYGNLKDILDKLEELEPLRYKYYNFYSRKFKKESYFIWESYHFQQLV